MEVTGQGRRLRRRVSLNRLQDVALCWWNRDEPDEELWPWTPTNTHRHNMVLLSCSATEGLKVARGVHTHTHTHVMSQSFMQVPLLKVDLYLKLL